MDRVQGVTEAPINASYGYAPIESAIQSLLNLLFPLECLLITEVMFIITTFFP